MSTNKSPAFQFYPKDWLSDANIMLMDWECRGMHIHLLCIAWFQNPPGTLPNDDMQIMKFLGFSNFKNTSVKRYERKLKSQVLVNFTLDEDPNSPTYDRWVHVGLTAEFKKQKEYKDGRSKNARQRWSKQDVNSICEKESEHMQCSSTSTALDKDINNISLSKKKVALMKDISIPEWIKHEDWLALLEHRKSLRSPINSVVQKQAIIARLKELKDQGQDVARVINTSIAQGWRGLFETSRKHTEGKPYGERKETTGEMHFRLATEGICASRQGNEDDVAKYGANSQNFLEASGDIFSEVDIPDKH